MLYSFFIQSSSFLFLIYFVMYSFLKLFCESSKFSIFTRWLIIWLRNDKWSSCFIYKNRINLINNSKEKFTLSLVFFFDDHIVSEVVKTKFVVSSIYYIWCIRFFFCNIILSIVYYSYGESKRFVEHSHFFWISWCEVVIYGYYVYWVSSKGIEVGREGSNKRFSFSCFHFWNISFVDSESSYELNVVWYHIPSNTFSAWEVESFFINEFTSSFYECKCLEFDVF